MNRDQLPSEFTTALEVATFGETMALMMPESDRGIEHVGRFVSSFAGAESNVAIGLARLGHRVGWFGRLGNDPFGRMALKGIRGEGVDVSKAVLADDGPTGLMFKETLRGRTSVFYYRKLSAASSMKPHHLDENYIKQAKILHVTGITAAISETARETIFSAIHIARKHGVKVSFDPNLRLKLWNIDEARPVILELASLADYYLPGLDELHLLHQTEDLQTIVDQLRQLNAVCVVKGAGEETLWVGTKEIARVPYHPVKRVVDTVGAGDGFCAGFLSGVLRGYTPVDAIQLGSVIGALVVQGPGDWESTPTWEAVESELQLRKHVER
jgi:2-dehydro-3-deoxygluconokinase